jgi:hypothetical protein
MVTALKIPQRREQADSALIRVARHSFEREDMIVEVHIVLVEEGDPRPEQEIAISVPGTKGSQISLIDDDGHVMMGPALKVKKPIEGTLIGSIYGENALKGSNVLSLKALDEIIDPLIPEDTGKSAHGVIRLGAIHQGTIRSVDRPAPSRRRSILRRHAAPPARS